MGYTTEFTGSFVLSDELSASALDTINRWSEGEDPNAPISGYCQWAVTDRAIEWDGNEKFYDYIEWLKEIIKLIAPEKVTITGSVFWSGEGTGDMGMITVSSNVIKVTKG